MRQCGEIQSKIFYFVSIPKNNSVLMIGYNLWASTWILLKNNKRPLQRSLFHFWYPESIPKVWKTRFRPGGMVVFIIIPNYGTCLYDYGIKSKSNRLHKCTDCGEYWLLCIYDNEWVRGSTIGAIFHIHVFPFVQITTQCTCRRFAHYFNTGNNGGKRGTTHLVGNLSYTCI